MNDIAMKVEVKTTFSSYIGEPRSKDEIFFFFLKRTQIYEISDSEFAFLIERGHTSFNYVGREWSTTQII